MRPISVAASAGLNRQPLPHLWQSHLSSPEAASLYWRRRVLSRRRQCAVRRQIRPAGRDQTGTMGGIKFNPQLCNKIYLPRRTTPCAGHCPCQGKFVRVDGMASPQGEAVDWKIGGLREQLHQPHSRSDSLRASEGVAAEAPHASVLPCKTILPPCTVAAPRHLAR